MTENIQNDLGEDIIKQLTDLILYLEKKLEEKRNGKKLSITPRA